jgi:hypothetical protein
LNRKNLLLLGFIICKIALQYFLINPVYQLHRDEYLHLDQAQHLAWGYVSVPPATSWVSYLIFLLGNSVFWVKFFPALFGALTLLVVWKTIETLGGNWFALVLGAVSILFSVLLRINLLYQPNSLDVLLWTTLYFTLVRYIQSKNPQWLYAGALAFALGFLNKYNIGFLLIGLLPALLFTPQRKLLANKHLYFSLGLALLLILPNLVWQYTHDFPVVDHMNELARTQLVNVHRADFLKQQLLFFQGSFFVILAALVSFFLYRPFSQYRVYFWAYIFTIATFTYFKAKGYYAIGLYPILIAFGAVYLEYLLQSGWFRYLRPLTLILPVLLIIRIFPLIFPTDSPAEIHRNSARYEALGLLRWEDGKNHDIPQDFADMLGWKELAREVDSASKFIQGKGRTLILTDNYGQAGAINYYSKNKNLRAVSLNADYIDWFDLSAPIDNLILVQDPHDTDKGREREKPFFETIRLIGEIKDPYAIEKGSRVYLLENAKVDINKILAQEISDRKHGKD